MILVTEWTGLPKIGNPRVRQSGGGGSSELWGYTPEVWSWLAVGFGGLALRGAAWAGGGGFPAMREGLEVDRLAHVAQESGGQSKQHRRRGGRKATPIQTFRNGAAGVSEKTGRDTLTLHAGKRIPSPN